MLTPARPARPGKLLLWIGVALIAVFAGLAVARYFIGRFRYASDAALLAELADATLDDEAGAEAGDWPAWRGPNRDGLVRYPALLEKWPSSGPKKLWSADGGDGYSSFAVAGDAVHSMVGDGSQESVVCWSLADGKEKWRRDYTPSQAYDYGGPRATPTVVGDRLYTLSSAGVLLCLKSDKGEVVWQRDLIQELGGRAPKWGYALSPLVEGDLVFVAPGGRGGRSLAAFNKADGTLAWSGLDDVAGYSSPVAATLGGERQVVFFTGERVVGVTPGEGKLLWDFPWKDQFNVNAATPLVIHGKGRDGGKLDYVFVSSGYGQGCALLKIEGVGGGAFRARPVYTSNEVCCHFASPVRHKGHVYALDETRDLTCLDVRTGQVAWRFSPAEGEAPRVRQVPFKKGSFFRVNDRLLVLGEEGKLALVACDPSGYTELAASRPFRDRCWSAPVLAGDGKLVLRDRKKVMCLDLKQR